jgi:trk system potassium uptake protein TrkH
VLLIGRLFLRNIETAFRARVVRPLKINGGIVDAATSERLVNYLVLITTMAFISVFLVAIMEPTTSFKGTFSAAIACLFNIGPGLAEVGPANNYSSFHDHTKIFLSLIMVMGRLELYAILVLFAPSLWKKFE